MRIRRIESAARQRGETPKCRQDINIATAVLLLYEKTQRLANPTNGRPGIGRQHHVLDMQLL